jgi:hypothetical protein
MFVVRIFSARDGAIKFVRADREAFSRGRRSNSSVRSVRKKYRSERKASRSFDAAIKYGTVAMMATERTRTAESAVRAAHSHERTVDGSCN